MALEETQREEVQLHFLHRVVFLETSYISLDDRFAVAKDSDARGLEDCVGSHEVARRAKRFPNYVAPPFRTKRAVLYHNPPSSRKGGNRENSRKFENREFENARMLATDRRKQSVLRTICGTKYNTNIFRK
jgi:hypothetical protein